MLPSKLSFEVRDISSRFNFFLEVNALIIFFPGNT